MAKAPAALTYELRELGLNCRSATSNALPATCDAKPSLAEAGMDNVGPGAGDPNTSLAKAESIDPIADDVAEEEDTAKGSADEAKTKEHLLTHLPKTTAKFARRPKPSAGRRERRL